jgi:hypothetical protein
VDELDDLMGNGAKKGGFFGETDRRDKDELEDRDPLGFLKKSEQVKKE